jgi:hypothetical protein
MTSLFQTRFFWLHFFTIVQSCQADGTNTHSASRFRRGANFVQVSMSIPLYEVDQCQSSGGCGPPCACRTQASIQSATRCGISLRPRLHSRTVRSRACFGAARVNVDVTVVMSQGQLGEPLSYDAVLKLRDGVNRAVHRLRRSHPRSTCTQAAYASSTLPNFNRCCRMLCQQSACRAQRISVRTASAE